MTEEQAKELSLEGLKSIIDEKKNLIVVMNKGSECEPCDYLSPLVDVLGEENKTLVVRVGITEGNSSDEEILDNLEIKEYPTVIAYKDGQEVKRMLPKLKFREDVDELDNLMKQIPPQQTQESVSQEQHQL